MQPGQSHKALSRELRGEAQNYGGDRIVTKKQDAADRLKNVRCLCRDCIEEMLVVAVEVKKAEQMLWFTKNELRRMQQAGQPIDE